jgi:hypothetical protein
MDEDTQQEPIRYTADDALRLLYALGYERRFGLDSQRSEFREVFPDVYKESEYDFLFAICLTVGRKIPLVRFEKNPEYRFSSGQYRKFGVDFDKRFEEKFGALMEDKVTLDDIIVRLRTEFDPEKPLPEDDDEDDSDIDSDNNY